MAQEAFEKGLTTEWTPLSDILTVDADTTYYIQNRGADVLIVCDSSSEPTDAEGILVLPYCTAKYKKASGDLYLRAFATTCSINITSEE